MLRNIYSPTERPPYNHDYITKVAHKATVYWNQDLQQSPTPWLDIRRQADVEALYRRLEKEKPSDPDLLHLTFFYQGSYPYSPQVEDLIRQLAIEGIFVMNLSTVILTPHGENWLEEHAKEYQVSEQSA